MKRIQILSPKKWHGRILLLVLLTLLVGLACDIPIQIVPDASTPPATFPPSPTATPIPLAQVTFKVTIPADTPAGGSIYLSILDEVTGLALNPTRYLMQETGERTYQVSIPLVNGATIQYRYNRVGTLTAEEHSADGRQVRYRLYLVNGPGEVNDLVTRWNDTSYTGPTGRISGIMTDAATGSPIPNLMVTAGGVQVLTAWDGSYLIENLPPATHLLVAYALDGGYVSYQQGATVAAQATTPGSFSLAPAKIVNVTFQVKVPKDTYEAIPLRLAGNLYQLGNTFANLSGGISTPAYRLPVLQYKGDHTYELTLGLPVGADIQYKYTLGDGFWNSEFEANGNFRLRELVVPDRDILIQDEVLTFKHGKSAPIYFEATIPANTPKEDTIAIQLNPYGWTPPIPMWKFSDTKWIYELYGPLDILGTIAYRYCRNYQCGSADDSTTAGPNSAGRLVTMSLFRQVLQDEIYSWIWLDPYSGPIQVPGEVKTRSTPNFPTGIELQPGYDPSWPQLTDNAYTQLKNIGANWVMMTPSWTFTSHTPPVLEILPGTDAPWLDQFNTISQARQRGFRTALFPTANFPGAAEPWWAGSSRDAGWWGTWFDRYTTFALHHAGLANRLGVDMLVLGGDWVLPALPGGTLADGTPSGVPEDAEARWAALLEKVDAAYNGEIAWAIPFERAVQTLPPFINKVNVVYILWSAGLSTSRDAGQTELNEQALRIFNEQLKPIAERLEPKIWVGVSYASADGAATGCILSNRGGCLDSRLLSRPAEDLVEVRIDLGEQALAVNALLVALNESDFIDGFMVRGYYLPATLRDKSTSIHGKPSEEVIKYWYTRLNNQP